MRQVVSSGLLTGGVAYAIAAHGGIEPVESSVSFVLIGLTAVIYPFYNSGDQQPLWARLAVLAAALFPAYVAFQILPLPLLWLASPTRADIAGALNSVATSSTLAPLSILPGQTWINLVQAAVCLLVFILARQVAVRNGRVTWAPALVLAIMGGLEAALGLTWRSDDPNHPVIGTYYNKNHFAGLLELVLPFALMFAVAAFTRRRRNGVPSVALVIGGAMSLALAILMFAAVGFSLSKAGFATTVASLSIMGLGAMASALQSGKRWVAIGAVAAAAVVSFLFLQPESLVRQYGTMLGDPTGEGRVPVAMDTVRLIAAYPLFGSGFGSYYPALLRYQTTSLDLVVTNAHNDYLQLAAELGLAGSLILATLVCALLVHTSRVVISCPSREARFLGLACLGSLAAVLLHSVADFNLYVPANVMVAASVAGIASSLPTRPFSQRSSPIRLGLPRRLGVGAVASLVVVHATLLLAYFYHYEGEPTVERVLCRVGICDPVGVAATLRSRGGAVPRGDLIEFLRRDPANPSRWEDLADSFQRSGAMPEARRCFERALTLGPRIPQVLVRAARFHFEQGESEEAFQLMVRALEGNPGFDHVVFNDYERFGFVASDVVFRGLPDNPAVWRSYLRRQLKVETEAAPEHVAEAPIVWEAIVHRRYADSTLANEYVEFTLRSSGAAAAARAWRQYAAGQVTSNRVFNGNFESDPKGGRFDWQIRAAQGTSIDFDRGAGSEGARAVRVRFDGTTNVGEVGIQQHVYLEPGAYRLQAHVRSKDISTDQGVFVRVVAEPSAKQLDVATASVRGSSDGTLLETEFQAPSEGALVRLSLARKPSLKFDNLVRGTLWIDYVSIVSIQNSGQSQSSSVRLGSTTKSGPPSKF